MIGKYLDLSTSHLTEAELAAVGANVPGLPRGIVHEYGAWLSVPQDERIDEAISAEDRQEYPNVVAVLRYAQSLDKDISWINFDGDGDQIEGLPTFEW